MWTVMFYLVLLERVSWSPEKGAYQHQASYWECGCSVCQTLQGSNLYETWGQLCAMLPGCHHAQWIKGMEMYNASVAQPTYWTLLIKTSGRLRVEVKSPALL